jgi:hypothetical protein
MHSSLREAARRSGISEEAIRRKILTGEIAALPVDDDRQYLVRLEDLGVAPPATAPERTATRAPILCLKLAFALFLVTMIGAIVTTAIGARRGGTSLCLNCALVRHDAGLHSTFESDELTDTLGVADCRHQWIRLTSQTGRSLRVLAEEMVHSGMVEAARRVDPKGAEELVRWCLGREWASYAERAAFATRAEFRAWFADLRARAAK